MDRSVIPVLSGDLLGRRRQLVLEGVELRLELRYPVEPSLHSRPLDLLHQLGDLELDANSVILQTRIVHTVVVPHPGA